MEPMRCELSRPSLKPRRRSFARRPTRWTLSLSLSLSGVAVVFCFSFVSGVFMVHNQGTNEVRAPFAFFSVPAHQRPWNVHIDRQWSRHFHRSFFIFNCGGWGGRVFVGYARRKNKTKKK